MLADRCWSDLEAELKSQPPRFERNKNLLEYMRNTLVKMYKEQEQMIMDAIDVPHIMTQLKAGAFDWTSTVRLLSCIMLMMRAKERPERHEAFDKDWR